MRKWLFMGASCLLIAALVLVASAAAAKGKPHKASRVTSALSVNVNQTAGIAKATGLVKVNGKKVSIRWHNVATRSDSRGNVCGGKTQRYTTRTFKTKDFGVYKLKFSLRTVKKYNGRYYTRSKTVTVDNDGDRVHCAKLTVPPPASAVCAWGIPPAQPTPASSQTYCGVPVKNQPAFVGPITRSGNVFSMGDFADPAGSCQQADVPVSGMWFGFPVQWTGWNCSDPVSVTPSVIIWLTHPGSDERCSDQPTDGGQLDSFQIPDTWGGTLYVWYTMTLGWGKQYFGIEHESAIFHLNGTEDGCSQLQDGPTG